MKPNPLFHTGGRVFLVCCTLIYTLNIYSQAHSVYHEQTLNNPGCGSASYISDLTPNSGTGITLAWRIKYDGYTDHTVIYYTTDGTSPSGYFGIGSGSTQVINGIYSCDYGAAVVNVATATIPAQEPGTQVNYIISAWSSAGGAEIFANGQGPSCYCGPSTDDYTKATVFTYTSYQTILIDPTGAGGFELGSTFADNGWGLANYATVNYSNWYLTTTEITSGNALSLCCYYTFTPTGNRAAYISANGGADWTTGVGGTGNNATNSAVHIYRDIIFPAYETDITLQFRYNHAGLSFGQKARLNVYLCSTPYTPVSNDPSYNEDDPAWFSTTYADDVLIGTFGRFDMGDGGIVQVKIPASVAGNSTANSTKRIVFSWINGAANYQNLNDPPVAIDDILLSTQSVDPRITSAGGVFTIDNTLPDSASNFSSFTSAINALNGVGLYYGSLSNSITFNVSGDQIFYEDPPPIKFGGTASYPVIFQRNSGSQNPIIESLNGVTGYAGAIILQGVDYVTFDGIDVQAANGGSLQYGYILTNASATNGATFNIIKNSHIDLSLATGGNRAGILQSASNGIASGFYPSSNAGCNNSNKYINNHIQGVGYGVYLFTANGTFKNSDNEIASMDGGTFLIGSETEASGMQHAIRIENEQNVKIHDIKIQNTNNYGIYTETMVGNCEIYNNKFFNIKQGIYLGYLGSSAHQIKIYNNFISATDYGIQIYGGTANSSYYIDNNSISIIGNLLVDGIRYGISSGGPSQKNIRNNSIANFSSSLSASSANYAIITDGAISAGTGTFLDYNNYYVTDTITGYIGKHGALSYTTFADWQTAMNASGRDAHSLSLNPTYINFETDLHTYGVALNAKANLTGITWVNTDIDGEARSASPDVGADEFTPANIDAGVVQLVVPEPATTFFGNPCYSNNQELIVKIKNYAIADLDLSLSPMTIYINVTGPVSYSLNKTFESGIIPAGESTELSFDDLMDMSSPGTYYFNAYTDLLYDENNMNDAMPAESRYVEEVTPLPFFTDFNDYAFGLHGYNFQEVLPGWTNVTGVSEPIPTTSYPQSSNLIVGSGTTIRWYSGGGYKLITPYYTITSTTLLKFKIAFTSISGIDFTGGLSNSDDKVIIKVSNDCGSTWMDYAVFDSSNIGYINAALTELSISLGALAGQNCYIAIYLDGGAVNEPGDYFTHIDDLNIYNALLCDGTPVTDPVSVVPASICANAAFTLSAANADNTSDGLSYQWQHSADGILFSNIPDATSSNYGLSNYPESAYFRLIAHCNVSGVSDTSEIVYLEVTDEPIGNTFENPIIIPELPYNATGDNLGCWTSNYTGPNGQTAADIFYKYTAVCNGVLDIRTCEPGLSFLDTYLHLLDADGNEIANNNNYTDDGPGCFYYAHISYPGIVAGATYYIVIEGANPPGGIYGMANTGTYGLAITIDPTEYVYYPDMDIDGFGDTNNPLISCISIIPDSYVLVSGDCNDADALIYPGAVEICNGIDDNCDGISDDGVIATYFLDADGDGFGDLSSGVEMCVVLAGYVSNSLDCDDSGLQYEDLDGDGFGSNLIVSCGVDNNLDCDDNLITFEDNDNDGFGSMVFAPCGITDNSDCDDNLVTYFDNDGDGFGVNIKVPCGVPTNDDCNDYFITYVDMDDDGYGTIEIAPCGSTLNTDCNDNSVTYSDTDVDGFGTYILAPCGVNNNDDCNDAQWLYTDSDGDGYGAILVPCGIPDNTDCDDLKFSVNPGRSEYCNGIDDNCNGLIDDDPVYTTYYVDADFDGYGTAVSIEDCSGTMPIGYSTNNTDCDDSNPAINPGVFYELPNGIDDDCNGLIDDDVAYICPDNAYALNWQQVFGGGYYEYLRAVFQTNDGGYLLAGISNTYWASGDITEPSLGSQYDYLVVKLDAGKNIEWQKMLGGNNYDALTTAYPTSDGGYIIGGSSYSGISGEKTDASKGDLDGWIVKLAGNGEIEWQKTIGGSSSDQLTDMAVTADNGYMLLFSSSSGISGNKTEVSFGYSDYWIVKLNVAGEIQWDKTIGADYYEYGNKIKLTSDGGYLISGNSYSGISGNKTEGNVGGSDYWLVKLNSTGTIEWQNVVGGSGDDYPGDAIKTNDGGFLIGGYSISGISGDKTENSKGEYDYWFVKLNSSGVVEWDKTIGGSASDYFNSIIQTADSRIILGGTSYSGSSGDKTGESKGAGDYWIVALNTNGDVVWDKTIGGNSYESLSSMQTTAGGDIIVGGYSDSGISGDKTLASKGSYDFWIMQLIPAPYDSFYVDHDGDGFGNADSLLTGCELPIGYVYDNTDCDDSLITYADNDSDGFGSIILSACGITDNSDCDDNLVTYFDGDSDGYGIDSIVACDGVNNFSDCDDANANVNPNQSFDEVNGLDDNCDGFIDNNLFCLDQTFELGWQKNIGGIGTDVVRSIGTTDDGGYIIGGYSNSGISGDKTESNLGSNDYWVVKTDAAGAIQWQNTIGGSSSDILYDLQQTTDGGYILGGTSSSGISGDKTTASKGINDYWIIKLNAGGGIDWQKSYGGFGDDYLTTISQVSDGGYVVGGYSISGISGDKTETGRGAYDYWILKTNVAGTIEWQKTIGGSSLDYLQSIEQASDGGFLIGGYSASGISGDKTEVSKGIYDYWIVKLSAAGSIEWQKTIGGSGEDYLYDVKNTIDGGFIIGGGSYSGISGNKTSANKGSLDFWFLKLNATGDIDWQNTLGGNNYDLLSKLKSTSDGGYLLAGTSYSNISGDKTENAFGSSDIWVLKINDVGAVQWQRTIGGSSADDVYDFDINNNNEILIGASSNSGISGNKTTISNGGYDYWLIKLNPTALGSFYYADTDGDGYGDAANNILTCDPIPDGYVTNDDDCDDTDSAIGIGTSEVCNGLDDDCNGYVDDGIIVDYFADTDGDGYGDPSVLVQSCLPVDGFVLNYLDCDDNNNQINPTAEELCNGLDDNCDGIADLGMFFTYYQDFDGDGFGNSSVSVSTCFIIPGYVNNPDDCNDNSIQYLDYDGDGFGSTTIVSCGVNNNSDCNDNLITYEDYDNDGFGSMVLVPCGVANNNDCNDASYTYADNDGDGFGVGLPVACGVNNNFDCDDTQWLYVDNDDDGFGTTLAFCGVPDNTDCDDTQRLYADNDNDGFGYGLPAPCGVINNLDCDDTQWLYIDNDGDGFGATLAACGAPDNSDCDDNNYLTYPGAIEYCNEVDDDCNGLIDDEVVYTAYYIDNDGDGYGTSADSIINCTGIIPVGYSIYNSDCDDNNFYVHPGMQYELPNGVDDNCDGNIDENSLCLDNPPIIAWQKTFGGSNFDNMGAMSQTADGGYILGGWSGSDVSGDKSEPDFGGEDYWIVKINSTGNIDWQNTVGGDWSDTNLKSIYQTSDGGYIAAGVSISGISGDKTEPNLGGILYGGADYWVVKLNKYGVVEWDNTIGGSSYDIFHSMALTHDGGYILAGLSASGISGDKTEDNIGYDDIWIVKLNNSGAIEWDNTIGGDSVDIAYNVVQTNDLGYLIAGTSNSDISGDKTEGNLGDLDYWIIKLDQSGNIVWQNTIGGAGTDYLETAIETSDGNYLLGGFSSSGISGDKTDANKGGFYDYWIVKYDESGDIIWQKTIGGSGTDYLTDLNSTLDGGFIVGGFSPSNISGDKTEPNIGGADYWVLKLDALGDIKWDKTFGGSDQDNLVSFKQTTDGGFMIGGSSRSDVSGTKTAVNKGVSDYWIIKLNSIVQNTYYADSDSDGYGDPSAQLVTCDPIPEGYVTNAEDCDDSNENNYPGAVEVCDGFDNNCDGEIDEGLFIETYFADIDNDGYGNANAFITSCTGAPAGYVLNSSDCDDTNADINPNAEEICDGVDNNCDGIFDEGCCVMTVDAGPDEDTYYGLTIDQTVSRTPTISGGTAPYTIAWTLSRPIMCDVITTLGDELFNATSCADNTCPAGINAPQCIGGTLITKLIDTATIYVTVTDANGCLAIDSFIINAEDVRCFAGASGIAKVKVCHQTGSAKNPCVTICVDESAVESHLAHGDFVGKCNNACSVKEFAFDGQQSSLNIYPNPTDNYFIAELYIAEIKMADATIELYNMTGQLIQITTSGISDGLLLENVQLGTDIPAGVYTVRVVAEHKNYEAQLVIMR